MCLAVPGKIVDTYTVGGLRMGRIDFGGVQREACLEYVPEAVVGDYTVIHVGFAISVLSEEDAAATLALLREIDSAGGLSGADVASEGTSGSWTP